MYVYRNFMSLASSSCLYQIRQGILNVCARLYACVCGCMKVFSLHPMRTRTGVLDCFARPLTDIHIHSTMEEVENQNDKNGEKASYHREANDVLNQSASDLRRLVDLHGN